MADITKERLKRWNKHHNLKPQSKVISTAINSEAVGLEKSVP